MLSRLIFSFLRSASGRAGMIAPLDPSASLPKKESRRAGVRGETLAYWYLRRHKFRPVAKNYTSANVPGEIDFIGYDGAVLAFVEVKYRAGADPWKRRPEDAVDPTKRSIFSASRTISSPSGNWTRRAPASTSSPSSRAPAPNQCFSFTRAPSRSMLRRPQKQTFHLPRAARAPLSPEASLRKKSHCGAQVLRPFVAKCDKIKPSLWSRQ
jgi:Holliday junction resolvase-like predicted endonuclease